MIVLVQSAAGREEVIYPRGNPRTDAKASDAALREANERWPGQGWMVLRVTH